MRAREFTVAFREHGWHVEILKYGRRAAGRVRAAGRRHAAPAHRRHAEPGVSEPARADRRASCARRSSTAPPRGDRGALRDVLEHYSDEALPDLIGDLGGHDLGDVLDALDRCDAERRARRASSSRSPIKGCGPAHRRPPDEPLRAALRRPDRRAARWRSADPARRVGPASTRRTPARRASAPPRPQRLREHGEPSAARRSTAPAIPTELGPTPTRGTTSTQEAFGRALVDLAPLRRRRRSTSSRRRPTCRSRPASAAGSTRRRVRARRRARRTSPRRPRRCAGSRRPTGQHIELGISRDEPVPAARPARASRPSSTARSCCRSARSTTRSSAAASTRSSTAPTTARKFVFAGTPSGVSLSPRGRRAPVDHHAVDRRRAARPALLRAVLRRSRSSGSCSTRSRNACDREHGESDLPAALDDAVDQAAVRRLLERHGRAAVRAGVLSGAYRLAEPPEGLDRWRVVIASCGALLPEALRRARPAGRRGHRCAPS